MFVFDGINKTIQLNPGVISVTMENLYSRWKDWVLLNDNAKFPRAFNPVGGDALGNNITVPSYYFLVNGWRIRTNGDGNQIVFELNLYEENGDSPFITIGSDTVVNRVSDIPRVEINTGSGLTPEQAQILVYLDRWAKADEEKNVENSKYYKRDQDSGEIILEKDYAIDNNNNETLTKP